MKLKRPGLTRQDIGTLILIGIVTLIVVSVLLGVNIGLSRLVRGGGSFFVGWDGARAYLFNHTEPYSDTVAAQVQILAYGRAVLPGENPYLLNLPFFLLPAYFPLALFSDPVTARGFWMFLGEIALLATAGLSLRMIDWQPRPFFLIVFFLLSVFSFYSVDSLLEGASAVLLVFMYVTILSAWLAHQDELVGALLVLSLFQWEVGLLFLLFMLWRLFDEQRSRVWAGIGMTLFTLAAASFLMYPDWIPPFLRASLATFRGNFGVTTAEIFTRWWPADGERLAQGLAILLIVVLGYEWSTARGADGRRLLWIGCLTLAVTPMLTLRTNLANLVVLFPGFSLIFAVAVERWRAGYWLVAFLSLIFLVGPWLLFARSLVDRSPFPNDLLFVIYPAFMIIGLYWVRWWITHPPVTWADRVEQLKQGLPDRARLP